MISASFQKCWLDIKMIGVFIRVVSSGLDNKIKCILISCDNSHISDDWYKADLPVARVLKDIKADI